MNTFLLNVAPNQNFGDAIAVQDLSGIYVENFVRFSLSNQNPGVVTGETVHCRVHYSCTRAVQYLKERKMGMQFYVIILILM